MAAIFYWVVYPATGTQPANDATGGAYIVAGQDGAGVTATSSGNEPDGTGTITASPAPSGLTAGVAYKVSVVWYDGVSVYSNVLTAPFVTGMALHWAVQPVGTTNWTDDATGKARIRYGLDGTGTALDAGSFGSQPYTATGDIDAAIAASGLTASTGYEIGFVVYDPVGDTYSNLVISSEITTAATEITRALSGASITAAQGTTTGSITAIERSLSGASITAAQGTTTSSITAIERSLSGAAVTAAGGTVTQSIPALERTLVGAAITAQYGFVTAPGPANNRLMKLRQVRTKQPPLGTKANPKYGFTSLALPVGNNWVDVNTKSVLVTGSMGASVHPMGTTVYSSADTSFNRRVIADVSGPLTVVTVISPDAGNTSGATFWRWGNTTNFRLELQLESSNTIYLKGDGVFSAAFPGTYNPGKINTVAFSISTTAAGTAFTGFLALNGQVATISQTHNSDVVNIEYVAGGYTPSMRGHYAGYGTMRKLLRAAELQAISANPWQLFEDIECVLPVEQNPAETRALTGAAITAAQGTVTRRVDPNRTLTGAAITAAQGAIPAPKIAPTRALTGDAVTAAQGTVTGSIAALERALSGAEVTAAQGALTRALGADRALTGAAITASQGVVGRTISGEAVTRGLTGAALVVAQGDIVAVISGVTITRELSGMALTVAAGTLVGTDSNAGPWYPINTGNSSIWTPVVDTQAASWVPVSKT